MPKTTNVAALLENIQRANTLNSPSGLRYAVNYISGNVVYLERELVIDDTEQLQYWLKKEGNGYVSLVLEGLRVGAELRCSIEPGLFTVKRISHLHGVIFASEYIVVTELTGWTVVRPV